MTPSITRAAAAAMLCFVIFLFDTSHARAQESGHASVATVGTPIAEVINKYRSRGYKFAYSTSLLTADVVIVEAPRASSPVEIISEILEPYDLTVDRLGGVWVIHRVTKGSKIDTQGVAEIVRSTPPIPELIVSASHYQLLRNMIVPGAFIDQQQIQKMPILGDDPVRAAQTLPGVAANSISAQSYVRGSDAGDTGIVLNGNTLLEPYHVRNFQSLFSAIDSRAVDGIEVFSGNFPVRYGNQIGGMMVIDTMEPTAERRTELGLSVFNTSVLSTGTVADNKLGWLVSARRGNLDLIIDDRFGEPSYGDFLGQLSAAISDNTTLSFNALVADDKIRLVTESKPSEPEGSTNTARTAQFWINWKQEWNPSLSSMTTVSINDFDNDRVEFVNDPEELVATIDDNRSLKILRLNQHWTIHPYDSMHQMAFGFELNSLDATYEYDSAAQYFGVFRMVEGIPASIGRSSNLNLSGQALGVYMSSDFAVSDETMAQFGIRWDSQNYGNLDKTSQLSPRFSVAHSLNKSTDIRASVGRYYQAQGMHELQVEDGVEQFFSAQRTDSITLGVQHRFQSGLSLRAEAYWKMGDRVRPRYENILNQVTVLPEFKPDRTRIAPDEIRSRGIEFSLQREYENGLTWWATYVLSSSEDKLNGTFVPRSWDQTHAARLGLSMTGDRWDLGVLATAHSGWPKTSIQLDTTDPTAPVISLTDRNQLNHRYFASLDVRYRYTQPIRKGKLTYTIELSNALNRRNACCVDFDVETVATNQYLLELESKNWLPLTPGIGILWQF